MDQVQQVDISGSHGASPHAGDRTIPTMLITTGFAGRVSQSQCHTSATDHLLAHTGVPHQPRVGEGGEPKTVLSHTKETTAHVLFSNVFSDGSQREPVSDPVGHHMPLHASLRVLLQASTELVLVQEISLIF